MYLELIDAIELETECEFFLGRYFQLKTEEGDPKKKKLIEEEIHAVYCTWRLLKNM